MKEKEIIKLLKYTDYSFIELKGKLNLDEELLYKELKDLIKKGIIVNYYCRKENTDDHSFYSLTHAYKDGVLK